MHYRSANILSALLLSGLLAFTGCGGGSGGGNTTTVGDDAPDNTSDPVATVISLTADAGKDQQVLTSTSVSLDGSESENIGSTDQLTYAWDLVSKPAGSDAVLSDVSAVNPQFTVDRNGLYKLQLTVDSGPNSDTDTVLITASTENLAPTTDAGVDQNVMTGTNVTLDGSASSDANSDDLTYRWSFISIAADSSARLSNPTAVKPTFTADSDGTYILELIVNDGTIDSSTDRVSITASSANSAPKAYAGDNQNVNTSTNVTLDGSKSSDANGDSLTYKWLLVSSPDMIDVSLSSTTAVRPTFSADRDGLYVFSLIVDDGKVKSTVDRVNITASAANSAPVAHNISYQDTHRPAAYYPGDEIYLVADASDANSDDLEYIWTFLRPPESTARILDSQGHSDLVQFTPDVPGEYVIKVTADDGSVRSNTVSLVLEIESDRNQRPVADAGPDIVVNASDTARFDGGSSFDSDGDELTYRWTLISVPEGAATTFYAEPEPYVAFMSIRQAGDYVMELIVNDGTEDSEPVRATYTLLTTGVLSMSLRGSPQ